MASKRKLRPWTRQNYEAALTNYLVPRFGNRKLASITASDVASLVREFEAKGFSRSYIDNLLKPVAGTFKLAIRRGLVGVNPVGLLTEDERPEQKHKAVHEWTPEEIEAFLDVARKKAASGTSRHDYYPLLLTAVRTGLRLGELLGLSWEDVDLGEHPCLNVRRQWTRAVGGNKGAMTEPKTAAAIRRIPLGPSMVSFFRDFARKSLDEGRTSNLVFASSSGTPLSHRNVQRRGFEKTRDDAGLPEKRAGKGIAVDSFDADSGGGAERYIAPSHIVAWVIT